MGLQIRLLGKPVILNAAGQPQPVRGLQPWALLARILLARKALDRRELAQDLFPDAIDPLGSLRWCLASLRRALGVNTALNGDPIEANLPADATVDILGPDIEVLDPDTIGDLLEGIEPRCSAAFSTWLLIERERMAALVNARIRQAAMQAAAVGDYERAIRLAETGVRRAPLDEGAHILLVRSLAMAGRTEAARRHVDATERAFLAELGERPTGALHSAAQRAVVSPSTGVSVQAVVTSLIDAGIAALAAGAAETGIDCLRRAAVEAERSQQGELQAKALLELGIGLVLSVRGYDDEGAILLGQCFELAQRCGRPDIAASAQRQLGYIDALAGRRPTAAEHLETARGLSDDAGILGGVHSVIGFNLIDWGQPEAGLDHLERAIAHARDAGDRRREAWSLAAGGIGQLAANRPEAAHRWLTRCVEMIDESGWIALRPWPLATLAEVELSLGTDPATLRPGLEHAFALSCQLRDPCWEGAVARAMALTYAAAEEPARATQWLAEARERCTRETDIYAALLVEIVADQARVSARFGQAAAAQAFAREMLSLAARFHMDAHIQAALALLGQRHANG